MSELLGLGLHPKDLTSVHVSCRTLVVMIVALAMIRLGPKRSLVQPSPFDFVLAIMLGSVLSRAINGSAPFVPTLVGGLLLVGLHWAMAYGSVALHPLSLLLKGRPVVIVRDGVVDEARLARAGYTMDDLREFLRLQGAVEDVSDVKLATLERSGVISVVKRGAARA